MRELHEGWLWVWNWLTKEGASRATVILVFITAWYALLTHRMARAMNRQTRAMIQPVLSVDFRIEKEEFLPKGSFTVKNLGVQPVLLLDTRLRCRRDGIVFFKEHAMYERHILPPQDFVTFNFDFTEEFRRIGVQTWSPGMCSFNLEAVASDLSEEMILRYDSSAYWRTLTVKSGMPLRLRWKFLYSYFRQRYYRIYYKFKPLLISSEVPRRKARPSWLERRYNQLRKRIRGWR